MERERERGRDRRGERERERERERGKERGWGDTGVEEEWAMRARREASSRSTCAIL